MKAVTLKDLSLRRFYPNARLTDLKKNHFRAVPEICTERAWLVTRYHLEKGLFDKDRISILDKARVYRYVLENRDPIVRHSLAYDKAMKPFQFKEPSLFAGSTTSKFKGVPLYPEFVGLALWPELWTISKRKSNPYHIAKDEVETLNHRVFPHWVDRSIAEIARKRMTFEGFDETLDGGEKTRFNAMELLEQLVFYLVSKPETISHTIPDFSAALNHGLRGMISEASRRKRAAAGPQIEFYEAVSEVLKGIVAYSNRLAEKAEQLARLETDESSKRELLEIAAIHRHVPEHPARTFREALTTVWICWIAIHLENNNVGLSLGRLDQVLYGFYERDVKQGILTAEKAVELVCCFWLKLGDHVPAIPQVAEQLFGGTGSNQAITLGGVTEKGEDAVNDLTYVMLRATELMRLRDPNVNARYHPRVNDCRYLKRLCEVNFNTGATPALHNDLEVIRSLTAKGDSLDQAMDYGIIGCVEPGSSGRFYGSCAAILINLTSALDLTLFNGRHRHTGLETLVSFESGHPYHFTSYDQFKEAFEGQVNWLIERATWLNYEFGKTHQDFYPTPILSAFFEGPMRKGKDLIQGGAEINASGATIVGLADVADSLTAIEKVVFEEHYDFSSLLHALRFDFKGYGKLHKRLMDRSKTPKYGNDDEAADRNVKWLVRTLDKAFGEKENYRGGKYRVGYWTMTNHAGLGRLMQALPNGRKKGENFASGVTPVSGMTPELTEVLNSAAKLPSECLSNGIALNLKFAPVDLGKEKMVNTLAGYVKGYFKDGGMEIQFNIIDRRTFLDVVQRPESEDYQELLVRVSGYTAYFRDLSPQMKKEIIDRTEYLLSTGKMNRWEPILLP